MIVLRVRYFYRNGALLKYRPDVLVFDYDPLETDKKPLVETKIIFGSGLLDDSSPKKQTLTSSGIVKKNLS